MLFSMQEILPQNTSPQKTADFSPHYELILSYELILVQLPATSRCFSIYCKYYVYEF
jgi:hypothetical protein